MWEKTHKIMLSEAIAQLCLGKARFNIIGHSKFSEMVSNLKPGNYFIIWVALNHPFSHGSTNGLWTELLCFDYIVMSYLSIMALNL